MIFSSQIWNWKQWVPWKWGQLGLLIWKMVPEWLELSSVSITPQAAFLEKCSQIIYHSVTTASKKNIYMLMLMFIHILYVCCLFPLLKNLTWKDVDIAFDLWTALLSDPYCRGWKYFSDDEIFLFLMNVVVISITVHIYCYFSWDESWS